MASDGEINLDEKQPPPSQPRGYTVRPRGANKPMLRNNPDLDDDNKVTFSCANGTPFLKISSALMVVSFVLQVSNSRLY